jgi:hypothetical protein
MDIEAMAREWLPGAPWDAEQVKRWLANVRAEHEQAEVARIVAEFGGDSDGH